MNVLHHNLSDLQFEELVIEFCVELLGNSVQGFSVGKDGGRDARFVGKPKLIESWNGTIVIQAKHTSGINKSYAESDFSGESEGSILGEEIPRIAALIKSDELDYYILFSNRRLTGVTDEAIRKRISASTGLNKDHIRIFDESELDRLGKRFPSAIDRADLNPGKGPADIDPQDLAEVITTLAQYKNELDELMEGKEPPPEQRITPEEKNKRKGLSDSYFKRHMRPRMVDFPAIRSFLAHPDHQPFVNLYEETAAELEAKLDAWEDDEVQYERLLESLVERLFVRDFDLRKHKRLTRSVISYMYCNCDIAKDIE